MSIAENCARESLTAARTSSLCLRFTSYQLSGNFCPYECFSLAFNSHSEAERNGHRAPDFLDLDGRASVSTNGSPAASSTSIRLIADWVGEDPPHILGLLGLSRVTSKNLKPAREEHGDGISDDSSTITSTAGDVYAELATLSHGIGLPSIAMDGATEPTSFSSASGIALAALNLTPVGKIARIPKPSRPTTRPLLVSSTTK